MSESTKTEVGSYFISNYPPFSQWTADQLDAVQSAMQTPPATVFMARSREPSIGVRPKAKWVAR